MDDLISKKGLLNKINAYVCGSQDKEFICKLIAEMPSVDAVEVVRCKDCRFYFFVEGEDRGKCDERIDSFRPFYPNDFCSYGERIDNDS